MTKDLTIELWHIYHSLYYLLNVDGFSYRKITAQNNKSTANNYCKQDIEHAHLGFGSANIRSCAVDFWS